MTTSTRPRERLSVQVDPQLDAEIKKLASERGCRVSDVVREALTTFVRTAPRGKQLEAPAISIVQADESHSRIAEEWWE